MPSQQWERGPGQLLPDCDKRGESARCGGEQALSCLHTPTQDTHTQMGWELVFWNAKSPDSALGILAECVLGNRPTGNRSFTQAILQVGGEQREQGI